MLRLCRPYSRLTYSSANFTHKGAVSALGRVLHNKKFNLLPASSVNPCRKTLCATRPTKAQLLTQPNEMVTGSITSALAVDGDTATILALDKHNLEKTTYLEVTSCRNTPRVCSHHAEAKHLVLHSYVHSSVCLHLEGKSTPFLYSV